MKKILCLVIAFALMMTPFVAMAENARMTLEDLYKNSNLTLPNQQDALDKLGREINKGLDASVVDGVPRPGTALMKLMGLGVNGTVNPYLIPENDWEKLMQLFNNGLLQYFIDGEITRDGEIARGESDTFLLNINTGKDLVGNTALEGEISRKQDSQSQKEEFYTYSSKDGDKYRVKLPFGKEAVTTTEDPLTQRAIQNAIMDSLNEDTVHWATTIDQLYLHLRAQPELSALIGYLFEGAASPADYTLQTEQLMQALTRAMHELAADDTFIEAFSQTVLPDLILSSINGYQIDAAKDLPLPQRKAIVTSMIWLVCNRVDEIDLRGLPEIALQIRNGAVYLDAKQNIGGYGYNINRYDFSFVPNTQQGGFDVRAASLVDGDASIQFSWAYRGGWEHRMTFVQGRNYNPPIIYTLKMGMDGLLMTMGTIPNPDKSSLDEFAMLEIQPLSGVYGYSVNGSFDQKYKVSGTLGMNSGDLSIDYSESASNADGVAASDSDSLTAGNIFHMNYNIQGTHLDASYGYTAVEHLDGTYTEDQTGKLSIDLSDDLFAMDLQLVLDQDSSIHAAAEANRDGENWTGNAEAALTSDNETLSFNGPLTVTPEKIEVLLHYPEEIGQLLDQIYTLRIDIVKKKDRHSIVVWTDIDGDQVLSDEELVFFGVGMGEGYLYFDSGMLMSQENIRLEFDLDPENTVLSFLYRDDDYEQVNVKIETLKTDLDTWQVSTFMYLSRLRVTFEGELALHKDSCTYNAVLEIPQDGSMMTYTLNGEDHYTLDMGSRTPFVMHQDMTLDVKEINHGQTTEMRNHVVLDHEARIGEREMVSFEPTYQEPTSEPQVEDLYGEPAWEEPIPTEDVPIAEPTEDGPALAEDEQIEKPTEDKPVPAEDEQIAEPTEDKPVPAEDEQIAEPTEDEPVSSEDGQMAEAAEDAPIPPEEKPAPIEDEPMEEQSASEPALSEDGYRYTLLNGEATLVGYEGGETELFVPSELGGAPLTEIGASAFKNMSDMTWIYLPSSINHIEKDAFKGHSEDFILLSDDENSVMAKYASENGIIHFPISFELEPEQQSETDEG
ncbi:hypothetical protein LJC33_06005 [Eubacteriales bacterium OttesenSCG-928-N13]|nr:hypothetical protein [Eubacteriales bacterium OttesenSCG-928-N13]